MLARGRTTSRCGWSRLGHPAGRLSAPLGLGEVDSAVPRRQARRAGRSKVPGGRQDVVWVPRDAGRCPGRTRGSHRATAQTSSSDSSGSVRLRPSSNQNRRHLGSAAWMPRGCRHFAKARDRVAKLDQPCRARPADRSLVAEDRSAGGVRDQTGPGTLWSLAWSTFGPHAIGTERFLGSPAVHRSRRSPVRSWETGRGADL